MKSSQGLEDAMKVQDLMSRHVRQVAATATISEAAAIMGDRDIGILPVVENGRIAGVVTDRDIAVRAVGSGLRSGCHVAVIMSPKVETCRPEEEIDDVLERMGNAQLRRLPVCSADGRVTGMFSLGDAARTEEYQEAAARTLSVICRPQGHRRHKRHVA